MTDRNFTPDDERSLLLDLYNATGGPYYWYKKTGWGKNSSMHHCEWFGIHCYENSSYIKMIDLPNNGLTGRLPNLWKIRNLQGICLQINTKMTGTISSMISSNMTRLRRLCLSYSGIYGKIPWDLILQLRNLEKIQLCCMNGKKLYGAIPQDIDRLPKIQVFSVSSNNIKGNLPLNIRNLTKLWFLDLEYVKLNSGELWYFSNMSQLTYLHLTNCSLRGTIPNDFGKTHSNIVALRLYGNKLHGEITSCFDGFQQIKQLILGSNRLHGLLPSTFTNLQTLQVLDLSNNNFTAFARNLSFSPQLQTLHLDGNTHLKIDGNRLLKALQPCRYTLRMLVARNCGFKGELSNSLFNFPQVMYIDLSNNNLTGHVPYNEACTMVYMFYFSLASNNFTGELPLHFFSPLKSLTYLDVRQNRFLKSKDTFLNINMVVTYDVKIQRDTFSCPTVRLSGSGGLVEIDPSYYDFSLCFCNKDYYGYHRYCKPCMKGGACNVEPSMTNKTQISRSTNEIEVKMNIEKGYWPCCDDFDNVTKLLKCHKQEIFEDEICNPSGDCKCGLRLANSHFLKTTCNSSCVCRHGNKGRFCSQCIDGRYKKGSLCVPCPEFRENFPVILILSFLACFVMSISLMICLRRRRKRVVIVLLFAFAVALVTLHAKSIIPGWFFMLIFAVWILGLSDAGKNLKSFWSIAVFFFQSLDTMLSDANVWPTKIVLLKYQITNLFNFEFSELTCSFSGAKRPEVSSSVILLLPVAGISLIWLMHALGKIFCGPNRNISSHRCKRWSLKILLLLYFPITAKTFGAIFSCEHRDGLSYLKNAPWLDCNGTSHNRLLILGYVSLFVFVIGIPLLIFSPLLYKYLDSKGQAISQDVDIWMTPLYEEFKPAFRRYFRLVFLTRRLLLAVFLTIVPTTSSCQILSITLLLITFIVITLVFRPYKRYSEKFEFETSGDVVVSIVLLLSFVSLASLRLSRKLDNSLVWLIISMNSVLLLCCFLGIILLFLVNLWKTPNVQALDVHYEPMLN